MSYSFLDKTGLASVWAKIKAALATKANTADLADIATSGSYNDLEDIPDILSANDDVVIEDKVPYFFRKSPDSDRAVEEIVGGTVGWNQLVQNGDFSDGTTGWLSNNSSISASNSVCTMLASATNSSMYRTVQMIKGHKYILKAVLKTDSNQVRIAVSGVGLTYASGTGSWESVSKIIPWAANSGAWYVQLQDIRTSGWTNVQSKDFILTDLTTMFGSTIADYIYSLETATAGAGVAKLKEWGFFTEDYYEYCEPTLRSVEGLVSKKTVGFNQWDEEWELGEINSANGQNTTSTTRIRTKNFIRVFPNREYYFGINGYSGQVGTIVFYDADKVFLGVGYSFANTTLTTPSDARYMRIGFYINYGTTYNHDICINLSDPTKNGQYEPYESHSYALDSEVVLRGVFKLDENNNLRADGDIYPSDGNGSRRYTEYTFSGTESLINQGTITGGKVYGIVLPDAIDIGSVNSGDFVSDSFVFSTTALMGAFRRFSEIRIAFPDTWSTSEVLSYLTGKKLLYELATPTTFTAQPYHNPQIVGDTEEFVTTGIVPVGHSTKYHTSYYTTNDYIKEKGYLTEKDILGKVNTSDLATVATSGSYNDLDDKPTIPTNEIFVGSTTPSGYTLYIDPEGSLSNGEGVSF